MFVGDVQLEAGGEIIDTGLGSLQSGQRRQLQNGGHANGQQREESDPHQIGEKSLKASESADLVAEEKERQLVQLIQEENLKEEETRKFIEVAFRDGSVKTTGTDIDKLMPPMSRFGGGNRAEKKQGVIAKLLTFFERFFGIG